MQKKNDNFLEKIVKKDYNNELEAILEKKYYNYLYLRTFTSIEIVYKRIKTIKK